DWSLAPALARGEDNTLVTLALGRVLVPLLGGSSLLGTLGVVRHYFFFLLPPLFQLRALSANVARRRVFGFFEFFSARNLLTGILLPFLTLAVLRNLPLFEGLM